MRGVEREREGLDQHKGPHPEAEREGEVEGGDNRRGGGGGL